MSTILDYLYLFIGIVFVCTPFVTFALLLVSIWNYVSARLKNRKVPGSYPPAVLKKRLIRLIIWSVVNAVLFAVIGGLIWLLATSIAYM